MTATRMRRWLLRIGAMLLALAGLTVAAAALLLRAWQAGPDDWAVTVRLGPVERALSVPALVRAATHPVGMWLLDGRRWRTRFGELSWQRYADGHTLYGRCEPCTLHLPALGDTPVALERVAWTLRREGQNRFHGTVGLGQGDRMIRGTWRGELSDAALAVQLHLQQAPIAQYYALFGPGIPELQRARIDGRAIVQLRARLPEGTVQLSTQVDGFEVAGLGTEALRTATPASHCTRPQPAGDPGPWLPQAVIAAEDQRFHEHRGYDPVEMAAAWRRNQRDGAPTRGASTLTQQLAKLAYTGSDRSHVRKLRELLYAVEMERTLGKARILELYLSLAPWGEGTCGAEAAARHLLGKPARQLTPLEAAWLASLLRSPDAQLARWRAAGEVDRAALARIVGGMRGLTSAQRRPLKDRLAHWQPAAPAASGTPAGM